MSDKRDPTFPRLVRPVPDPLGLYLRPGHNDHRAILELISSGDFACFGIVVEADKTKAHAELREQILKQKLDAILDPKTLQASTPGGFTEKLGQLPWGVGRPHNYDDFEGISGHRHIAAIADFALEHEFTQIMAPTHMISSLDDPWLRVDANSICLLRNHLDKTGAASLPVNYQLVITYKVFRNSSMRQQLIDLLKTLPIASLWLRVDGIGRESTGIASRNYIEAASDFHSLGIPMVADHLGGVFGLSQLAFGAVGGISHGITLTERFNGSNWRRPSSSTPFKPVRKVYVPSIDSMLKVSEASELINSSVRGRAYFACSDSRCCPRGVKDMLENPARHFLYQRIQQITGLSQIPEMLRPQRFLDQHLRPATDKAVAAANIEWATEKMTVKMQKNRKRLDGLRISLGDYAGKNPPRSFSLHPKTRVARDV